MGTIVEVGMASYAINFDNECGMWYDKDLKIESGHGLYINKTNKGLRLIEGDAPRKGQIIVNVKAELDLESIEEIKNIISDLEERLSALKIKLTVFEK
jgi:hypothetical protein